MVNNSNNVNKTNNHFPSKLTEYNKRSRHMTLEIQVLSLFMHKHEAGLNRLIKSLALPSW